MAESHLHFISFCEICLFLEPGPAAVQETEGGAVSQIRRLFIEEILVVKKCVSFPR